MRNKKGGYEMKKGNVSRGGGWGNLEKSLFFIPIILVFALAGAVFVFPEGANNVINGLFSFITGTLGWSMQIFYFLMIFVVLYLIFGKVGSKRLGAEKPEFSNAAWFGMIFTGGTSATIVYWGAIDWFTRYAGTPPFGVTPFSEDAYLWATSYTLFDWGPLALSPYAIVAVVFGFLFYVRREETNRPSVACDGLLKQRAYGATGKAIDIIYMFGILGGVAASVGLSTPLLAELLHTFFGIENGLALNAGIVAVWTVFFIVGVYGGLKKTVEMMSNWRMWLLIAGCIILFIFTQKTLFVHTLTDALGNMITNFFRMNFYSDALGNGAGYPFAWTIFFYGWWLAYALSTGIYIARISRGRTVRSVMLAGLGITVVCIYAHHIFFGYFTADVFVNGNLDVLNIFNEQGAYAAIVAVWQTLPGPFGMIVMILMALLTFISGVTVINGTAYSLAIVSTKKLSAQEEPAKLNRVIWAFALGALGLALMFLGGLKPVQTACICTGFLTMIVIAFLLLNFFKCDMKKWDSYMKAQVREKKAKGEEIIYDELKDLDEDDSILELDELMKQEAEKSARKREVVKAIKGAAKAAKKA